MTTTCQCQLPLSLSQLNQTFKKIKSINKYYPENKNKNKYKLTSSSYIFSSSSFTLKVIDEKMVPSATKNHHFLFFFFALCCFFFFSCSTVFASVHHDMIIIRSLPGFPGPLPFHLETGYIGVGSKGEEEDGDDVQLFYYFMKSERNPEEDPVLLWITGGPGCSAFSGLVYEIGPLKFDVVQYNGSLPTLGLNPYSWTKTSNIIFLDSPVGTGFSYSRSPEGSKTGDFKSSQQTYQFLIKWLTDHHPEFISNPFYIGGDSYSGMTVPLIVKLISDGIVAGNEPSINLKGYLVGNPVTVPQLEHNSRIPFFHGMGMLSDELYESLKKSCAGEYKNVDPSNIRCIKNVDAYSECVSGINNAYILDPNCAFQSPRPRNPKQYRRSLGDRYREFLDPTPVLAFGTPPDPRGLECRSYAYLLSYYWTNDETVRKALYIHEGSVPEWQRCNFDLHYQVDYSSSFPYHVILSQRGYRSLVYSGDHDTLVPYISTQAWIRLLNYSIIDDWRAWFVDGQVGGYTRTYSNNMTFATVKGGGHTAPEYRPKECLAMFKKWIFNELL